MKVRKLKIENLEDAKKIIMSSNCDKYVYAKFSKKIISEPFIVEDIDNRLANILKQEAISCGADVAVDKDVSLFKKGVSTVVICANKNQIEKLSLKIKEQPFVELKNLSKKITEINSVQLKEIICSTKKISLKNKPLIMGIVNLSPDSFFKNGIEDETMACNLAQEMQECGADIIDVGAESTRPGSKPVAVKEEIKKIKTFLKIFRKKSKIPVSVDTYKSEVVEVALAEGADIINDIYALRYGKDMAKIISQHKAGVVLMHMKKNPLTMQKNIRYNNVISEIFNFLDKQIEFALESGIKKDSIIVDPGIGFGKTVENNSLIIKRLFDFKSLNVPLLVGLSNKSFLAKIMEDDNLNERLTATIIANTVSVLNGADILRVHDVKETKKSLKIIKALGNL
jgi:dihydropteroate synthase